MQMLSQALTMSPFAVEEFKRAERARVREIFRLASKIEGADERISVAEAKRQRRRERNLRNAVAA